MINIENNLKIVRANLNALEQKYHRKPGSVTLLAVSKQQSFTKMKQAFLAGQRAFGESYLQEALEKIQLFQQEKINHEIEWHFIGGIQRNKTRQIAEHFAWVHSLDDAMIAKRLNEQRPTHAPRLSICIQVNISQEPTKSGVVFDEVFALAEYCYTLPQLHLRGLMAVPSLQHDFAKQRESFHTLFLLWQALREKGFALDTLSMGMSDDMEAAIAEGATIVRIGQAIFGERIK